jgi:hypothetical protein
MQDFDLEKVLLNLGESRQSANWRIRDAVEGLQIFGGIGSGKTSGSGRTIALKYLSAGFGGLVLTAKPDEKDMWVEFCKKTNRLDDLLIVEPGGNYFFNFLDYESKVSASGEALTANIVQVLKTVIKASEEKSNGKSDDPFWESALDMLIYNTIDLCLLTGKPLSIDRLFSIVQSIPRKPVGSTPIVDKEKEKGKKSAYAIAFAQAGTRVTKKLEEWERSQSPEYIKSIKDEEAFNEVMEREVPETRTLKFLDHFFKDSFVNISEKTRAIIDFTFSGFLFRLLKEPVYSLFCRKESNFSPEDSLKGKIILLNLPVKLYNKVGQDCQIMFKYIWQRAMEKRDVKQNPRPVFLWADESQNFLHEYDAEYQATARSSRIATVYISQNLPNYYASMGGLKAEYRVQSFLGTLGTKIFHANADIETNEYASSLFGEAYTADHSRSSTVAGEFSVTKAVSFSLEKVVRPEVFTRLKTGGPENGFFVEGYLHKQGGYFGDKLSFKFLTLSQIS